MKPSITQESNYGCGVACFAFAIGKTYQEAIELLAIDEAKRRGIWCKDLSDVLNKYSLAYKWYYAKPRIVKKIYQEGVIVFIRRSANYPVGHYLIRHNKFWMDPCINLPTSQDIAVAKSGLRKRLPGRPMYVFLPLQK